MELLNRLQKWYHAHCDGDWEHSYGVKIDTLDNPGWSLCIDLVDTLLEDIEFASIEIGDPEDENNFWINCYKEEATFISRGSVNSLEKMISIFLDWAESNTDTTPWDDDVSRIYEEIQLISKEKSHDAINRLRNIYQELSDIPTEHPQKLDLLKVFDNVWKKQWE